MRKSKEKFKWAILEQKVKKLEIHEIKMTVLLPLFCNFLV